MSENNLAFIFPAFASDYSDHPGQNVRGFKFWFNDFLKRAAFSTDPKLAEFTFNGQTFADDELRTQYLTYIYSCAAAAALRNLGFIPSVNAGYSMGIYASLFDAEAISFESGLKLIEKAYQTLSKQLKNNLFSMVSLIGLNFSDVNQLNNPLVPGVVNTN